MRKALIFLVALLVTPALPGVAGAHVDVAPTEAPAGKATKLSMVIGHGCEGASTTSVTVQVPDSVKDATAGSVDGWKASNKKGQMKWTGGPLPDHDVQELPFTAIFFGKKGERVPLKLIQGCEGNLTTAWIQVVPEGAAEPETPAPIVTLTTTASEPAAKPTPAEPGTAGVTGSQSDDQPEADQAGSADEDEGLADGLIIGMFALAAVGLIAGGIYWVKRNPGN